MNLIYIYIF